MTEEKKQLLHPISNTLVSVYNILLEKGEVFFPVTDENIDKLDTIAKTVNEQYFDHVRYPTSEDQAAAYFCLIIKDHPMTDGNKRLAVLWLDIFCTALELQLSDQIKLDELAVSVEADKETDVYELSQIMKIIFFS